MTNKLVVTILLHVKNYVLATMCYVSLCCFESSTISSKE